MVECLPSCVSGFNYQNRKKKRMRRKKRNVRTKEDEEEETEERELFSRKEGSLSTIPLLYTKWHRTVED